MAQNRESAKEVTAQMLAGIPQNRTEDDVVTIDLLEIFYAILGAWKQALLAMLIGGLIFASYHTFLLKPTYQADASIFITNTDSVITFSDLQLSSALTEDYARIIKSRAVLKEVIADLQLDMDFKELEEIVSITNPDSSHIIQITVTCGDMELARNITNSFMNIGVNRIYEIVGNSEPTIVDYSEAEAVKDVTPGLMKYLAIGAFLGLLLVCGLVCLKVITDTTMKEEDDILKYLQVPVLAVIPFYEDTEK